MGTTSIERSVSMVFRRLRHLLRDFVSSWVRRTWLTFNPTFAKASIYIFMSRLCPTEASACFFAISFGFFESPMASMPHAMAPLLTAKLTVLLAVATMFPCESKAATVTTETSRPSARIVLRSGHSAIIVGVKLVVQLFVISGTR